MKIVTILASAAIALVCAESLRAQGLADSDRQAAAAALALLDARGHLPERWVAAPFEIMPGDHYHDKARLPYLHPAPAVPETKALLTWEAGQWRFTGDEPIPVMVRRRAVDREGITLVVEVPEISPHSVEYAIKFYSVRVEGLGTDELSVRIVQESVGHRRIPPAGRQP